MTTVEPVKGEHYVLLETSLDRTYLRHSQEMWSLGGKILRPKSTKAVSDRSTPLPRTLCSKHRLTFNHSERLSLMQQTALESALTSLAQSTYWLSVVATWLVPITVISLILLFIVAWQILHIRSDTSYLRNRSDSGGI